MRPSASRSSDEVATMYLIHYLLSHEDTVEDSDQDLYTMDGIDASSDDDEISIAEEGFMRGYRGS